MAEASSTTYRNLTRAWPEDGYTNGLVYERTTGDIVMMIDTVEHQRWSAIAGDEDMAPNSRRCVVFEDFLGKALNVTDSVWAIKDTSSAGTPVTAIAADADHGAFKLGFAANDEAEILTLYWNDELNIDATANPVFTCRLQLSAQPAATDTLVFGLASAQSDTADNVAANAWFRVQGANLNLMVETDDGTTDDDDNDTTVDLTAATYAEFKIDLNDLADVRFYYRTALNSAWTRLLSGTAFSLAALTASSALQPFIQLQKSGGTQETFALIDYVKVAWDRA